MNIGFEKVATEHLEIIFSWLAQDFIREFWDNTQAHKDDILNFVQGRKSPSTYANGQYVYWVAKFDHEPFAMLMTIQETHKDDIGAEKQDLLSKTGKTYGLEYMIGNLNFFGKGYGARTLSKFIDYFRTLDPKADTFLIDPDCNNTRAKHVYMKAGFDYVCDFMMTGDCSGTGKLHHLLVKKFDPIISIHEATISDYPLIQNMARFYVYDLSKECGHISSDWELPADGLYESFDFKNYFEDSSRKAYLIKVYAEIAGFALLRQDCEDKVWNMGEFFILAKFQNQGIGRQVMHQIWNICSGPWEVSVIPENKRALSFWRNTISRFQYAEKRICVDYDKEQPMRIIFNFNAQNI